MMGHRGLALLALIFFISLGCGAEDISSDAVLKGLPSTKNDLAPNSEESGVNGVSIETTDVKKNTEKLGSEDVAFIEISDKVGEDPEEEFEEDVTFPEILEGVDSEELIQYFIHLLQEFADDNEEKHVEEYTEEEKDEESLDITLKVDTKELIKILQDIQEFADDNEEDEDEEDEDEDEDEENEDNELEIHFIFQTGVSSISDDEKEYSHIDGRVAPSTSYNLDSQPYVITETRLKTIRSRLLYPFYDQGGDENLGDYQRHIHSSSPQLHKDLDFLLPFYGFSFNYMRVSMHGYLEFSDPPPHYTYPLIFPVKGWPVENDPSFIGIFYSKCRIGSMRTEDIDQRKPGVYFRIERNLQRRTDQSGIEIRERLTWDIRSGVNGASDFKPKHAAIVTWKNMSFAGGIDNAIYKTNTFQIVLATDEVYTYAIFNYADLQWTSHTEAGGDTAGGEGGVPAFVGFNAGNGTQSFEYMPYSQSSVIRYLTESGYANQMPGRHIFQIDSDIMLGTCDTI